MATHTDSISNTRSERLETRLDPETKRLAERAAALGFGSMADYITRLIREDAPKRLAAQALIQVTSDQFDHFLAACNDTSLNPSERLRKAAARLDKEGFDWR
ncbi:MAG: DUF1778 domain-containing protein [Gammaproteobacteria bacterium]|nr:DUF1778 domain-containing protein [Gammaproteobacteria bacterium]